MPKRTLWTAVGYSAGVASSVYLQRRVKRAVQRVAPAEVRGAVGARGADVVERAKRLGSDVRAAAVEGRRAMRDEQQRLEQEFGPGGAVLSTTPPVAPTVAPPAAAVERVTPSHRARSRRFSPR